MINQLIVRNPLFSAGDGEGVEVNRGGRCVTLGDKQVKLAEAAGSPNQKIWDKPKTV